MKQQNEWKRHKRGKQRRNAKDGRKEETRDANGAENYGGARRMKEDEIS